MHEPIGRYLPISDQRRFVMDLVHFGRQVPLVPVARTFQLGPLVDARVNHPRRPSWALVFMKAYARIAADYPTLRRCYLKFPWARFYEHPQSTCALAMERTYKGEDGIFVALFRAPECQSLEQLQSELEWYQNPDPYQIGLFRQALRLSRLPLPLRRGIWWYFLNTSGLKRAKKIGTFGVSTYGSLGAESLHPISPLSTTLTYGPIDARGEVIVKIVYDHRLMDGAFVARRLVDLEQFLQGEMLQELRDGHRVRLTMPHTDVA